MNKEIKKVIKELRGEISNYGCHIPPSILTAIDKAILKATLKERERIKKLVEGMKKETIYQVYNSKLDEFEDLVEKYEVNCIEKEYTETSLTYNSALKAILNQLK